MKLRWDLWILGLVQAVIGGGAGAVCNTSAAAWVAPDTFNLSGGFHKTMALMGITFALSAALAFFSYLKAHPTPDTWDGTTDRRGPGPAPAADSPAPKPPGA